MVVSPIITRLPGLNFWLSPINCRIAYSFLPHHTYLYIYLILYYQILLLNFSSRCSFNSNCKPTPSIFSQLLKRSTFVFFHLSPFKFAGLMASSASKPAPAKKLREHLQDQQEPFSLDNYVSERSYMKRLSPDGHSVGSTNDLMRSRSYELNRGRKRVLYGTKILASVISKLIPTNSQELSNGIKGNKDEDIFPTIRRTQRTAETNSFFSTKCLNAYLSTGRNVEELSLHSTRHHHFTHASTSMTFKFGNLTVEVQKLLIINHGCKDMFQISFSIQHYFAVVSRLSSLTKLTDCCRYNTPLDKHGR